MKKLFILIISALCIPHSAFCTAVYFPALDMTGSTNDITINVRAVNNPVIWNNQFYYLPRLGTNLTTTDGTVTNSFVPGIYTMAIPGLGQSWTLYVTNSATPVSAVALSRGLVNFSGLQTITAYGLQLTNDGYGNYFLTDTNTNPATISTNIPRLDNTSTLRSELQAGAGTGSAKIVASVGAGGGYLQDNTGGAALTWNPSGIFALNGFFGNGFGITNFPASAMTNADTMIYTNGATFVSFMDAKTLAATNNSAITASNLAYRVSSTNSTTGNAASATLATNIAPTTQTIAPAIFGWLASTGAISGTFSSGLSLLTSSDGTNWTPALTPVIYHPDAYTNAFNTGPVARRWSIIDTNGYAYAAQATRGFFGSDSAGSVDIFRSQDLTNWARIQTYSPFSQSYFDVIGANWFRHSSGAVYLILSGTTNLASSTAGHIWAMRATDNTFTNWATPTIIKFADVSQEGLLAQGTNGILTLFYRCIHPGLEWFVATNANNNLTTLFSPCRTNFGGSFGNGADSGGLSMLDLGAGHFRAYTYSESGGTNYYTDSINDLQTWNSWQMLSSISNKFVSGNPTTYYGNGIFRMPTSPAGLSNQTYYIGQSDSGSATVRAPILRARTFAAREGCFDGGMVAESVYARNVLTAGRAVNSPNYYGKDIFLEDASGVIVVEISKDGFIVIRNANGFAAITQFSDGSITALDSDGNPLWSVDSSGNFNTIGQSSSTNGIASFLPTSGSIAATGYTNNTGANVWLRVTCTSTTITFKERDNSTLDTWTSVTGTFMPQLQPGRSITAASGLAGKYFAQ